MTFKSTAVRGKCWKRARWSKRIWKILVKHYGPNTLIIVKIKSQRSLKLICEKPTVEKATLPLLQGALHLTSLCHCGCPQVWWPRRGATMSWEVVPGCGLGTWAPAAKPSWCPDSPCRFSSSVLSLATAIPWKTLLNMPLELVNAVCLSEELYFNACAK